MCIATANALSHKAPEERHKHHRMGDRGSLGISTSCLPIFIVSFVFSKLFCPLRNSMSEFRVDLLVEALQPFVFFFVLHKFPHAR